MNDRFNRLDRERTGAILKRAAAWSVIAILFAGLSAAQSSKTQGLLMALASNGKQLASYRWKQRITVVRKGEALDPIIEEIRVDSQGQLQRTTLVKPEERRSGPIRARKTAAVKDSVQEVMQLARLYASPQRLREVIEKGEHWEGHGTLRIQARSVVLPNDDVTMVVNTRSFLPTQVECKTTHDGGPVTIVLDYNQLPSGPSAMTRMTVRIPDEHIVVYVDSYDYFRLADPQTPTF